MKKRNITLIFMLLLTKMFCNAQEMDFQRNLEILNVDYGTCYTIGNYMICPECKTILRGQMFGTATKDCFGYFPDSTLKYNEVTLIIFGGQIFFDNSGLNLDWNSVKMLSYSDDHAIFTDGEVLYNLWYGEVTTRREPYDVNTYKPADIENRLPYRKKGALTENFLTYSNKFFCDRYPVLEPFDVPKLRTIVSNSGFETNYITDDKQVLFGGSTGGYSITTKNGKEYVLVQDLILEGVDLPSVRVLGRDLIADKNALYYRDNIIPFDKLNGFKMIIRELK